MVLLQYVLGTDPHEFLLEPIKRRMESANRTHCGGKADVIIKRLEQSIVDAFGPRKTHTDRTLKPIKCCH